MLILYGLYHAGCAVFIRCFSIFVEYGTESCLGDQSKKTGALIRPIERMNRKKTSYIYYVKIVRRWSGCNKMQRIIYTEEIPFMWFVITPKLCNTSARCTFNTRLKEADERKKNMSTSFALLFRVFYLLIRSSILGIRNQQPANKWCDLVAFYGRHMSRDAVSLKQLQVASCNIIKWCSFFWCCC